MYRVWQAVKPPTIIFNKPVLQSGSCCVELPFGTLSYKRHEFRWRFIEYKMCVPISYTSSTGNISHSENNLARYCQIVNRRSCKLLVSFSEFIHTWICRQIFEVLKYKIKLNSSGVSRVLPSGQTHGQTVWQTTTKPIVAYRCFANASKDR